jgi:hypothetical protein
MYMEYYSKDIDRRKPKHSEKTSSTTTLSTINLTCTGLGRKPGLCGGGPATSLLAVVIMNPPVQIPIRHLNAHQGSYFPRPS